VLLPLRYTHMGRMARSNPIKADQATTRAGRMEVERALQKVPAGRSPFEVLGVTRESSKEEIKAAYHRVAQQYHPDKVATLAPEFRELAERRMKEINAAYDQLRSQGLVT
jgi:DnaJ like chaperone protein